MLTNTPNQYIGIQGGAYEALSVAPSKTLVSIKYYGFQTEMLIPFTCLPDNYLIGCGVRRSRKKKLIWKV